MAELKVFLTASIGMQAHTEIWRPRRSPRAGAVFMQDWYFWGNAFNRRQTTLL
jgi:hypothetical protein